MYTNDKPFGASRVTDSIFQNVQFFAGSYSGHERPYMKTSDNSVLQLCARYREDGTPLATFDFSGAGAIHLGHSHDHNSGTYDSTIQRAFDARR